MERLSKLKKKQKKARKNSTKRARDSSDSDFDSDEDYGSDSMRKPLDKCLKLEQPKSIHLMSTDTPPI